MKLSQLREIYRSEFILLANKQQEEAEKFWDTHYAWNPLNWIDYTLWWFNKLQTNPLIAIVRTYAVAIAGGDIFTKDWNIKTIKPADDLVDSFKVAHRHVTTGDRVFTQCLTTIIDGAIEAANYDATTLISAFSAFLVRWIWRAYQKATFLQTLKWWIKLLNMPSTEEQLLALVEKKLLSTKSLVNSVILFVFVVWKVAVLVSALISIHIVASGFRDTQFRSLWLQQKNPLVKDRSLGRRRQRKP